MLQPAGQSADSGRASGTRKYLFHSEVKRSQAAHLWWNEDEPRSTQMLAWPIQLKHKNRLKCHQRYKTDIIDYPRK